MVPRSTIADRAFPSSNNIDNIYKGTLFGDLFLKNFYENFLNQEKFFFDEGHLSNFNNAILYLINNRNTINEETTKNKVIKPILLNYLGYEEHMFLYETPLPNIRTDYLLVDGGLINTDGTIIEDDLFRITTVVECKRPTQNINLKDEISTNMQNDDNFDQIMNYLYHESWKFRFGIWTNGFIWVLFKKEFGNNTPFIHFNLEKIYNSPLKNNYFFLFCILFRKKNLLEKKK